MNRKRGGQSLTKSTNRIRRAAFCSLISLSHQPSWADMFRWGIFTWDMGPRMTVFTSETWLACFLLASDTGGDDLIATRDRWRRLQVGIRPKILVDFLLCNVLNSTLQTPGSNYGSLHPSLFFPQPLQPLPLTYESVTPLDYRFHWILFFFYRNRATSVLGPHPCWVRKLEYLWLVVQFIILWTPTWRDHLLLPTSSALPVYALLRAVPSCVDLNSTHTDTTGSSCT